MVARFLWILPAFAVVTSARGIWIKDSENPNSANEEQLLVEPYILENKILESVYKLKDLLKNGVPEAGVPPFDPLFLPYKDFDFILKDSAVTGYIENVTFTNFSRFEPENVQFRLLPLHFKLDLAIDRFQIDGKYEVQGKILNTPVDGVGQFKSEIKNLTVSLYLRFTSVNISFQIKDLIFEFKTANIKLECTNELYSNQFQRVNEGLIFYVLEQVQDEYIPPVLTTFKILFNRFLLGYTAADVFTFIKNVLQKE